MGTRWPLQLTVREGVLNALAGGVVAAGLLVATAWASAGAGVADAVEVQRLVVQEQRWIAAGGLTLIAEPAGTDATSESLDAARCDRLAQVEGVTASFAVVGTGRVLEPRSAPGTSATLFAVSPGAFEFFGITEPAGVGVIAPAATAEDPGFSDGERTVFASSRLGGDRVDDIEATVHVIDSPILGENLAGTYLMPGLLTGGAEYCYVASDAAHRRAVADFLPGAMGSETAPAVVYPRVPESAFAVDFESTYQERVTRFGWAAAAVFVALAWALVQRSRRGRLAVYSTFGAGPAARLVMVFSEWVLISGSACLIGWVLGTGLALGLNVDAGLAVTHVSQQVAAMWCASSAIVLLVSLAPIGSILDSLKDRT